MDSENLIYVLRAIGVSSKITQTYGNLQCSCPFASYGGHKRGTDKHPSFSIRINPFGESMWNCFTCGRKGTVRGLIHQYEQESGRDLSNLKSYINERQEKSSYRKLIELKKGYIPNRPIERDFHIYDGIGRPKAITPNWNEFKNLTKYYCSYARDRGISKASYARWKLGFSQEENRLFIPIFDKFHKFVGYSKRLVIENVDKADHKLYPKYKHMYGFYKEEYRYGENLFNYDQRRIIIVEGFFDAIALDALNIRNVVAKMGTTLSKDQLRKVCEWADTVIIIPDNDPKFINHRGEEEESPGLRGAATDCNNLRLIRSNIRIIVAPTLPHRKDVAEYEIEEMRWLIGEIKKMMNQ